MHSSSTSYYDPKYGVSEYGDIYDNAGGRARRQARKTARKAKHQANHQARVTKRTTRKNNRIARRNQVADGNGIDPNAGYPMDNGIDQSQPFNNQQSQSYPAPMDESYPDQGGEEQPEEMEEEEEPVDSYFGEDGECLDLSYYGDEFDNGSGKERREARRAAEQKKRDLKNERLDSKNKARQTRAEAKLELSKKGIKTGFDVNGAIDGVLGIFGGGKKSAADSPDGGGGDPGTGGGAPTPDSGKLLGMPKGVAIGVIVVVVLVIIAVIYFVTRKKK